MRREWMFVARYALRIPYLKVFLVVITAVGLWPHLCTRASWLAAAIFAGVFFSLGTPSLRSRSLWWVLSAGFGLVFSFARAKTHLVVRPELLMPTVDQAGLSSTLLVLSAIASVAVVWGLRFSRDIAPRRRVSALLLLAIVTQAVSSLQVGTTVRRLSSREPGDYSYNFDGIRYLKSFYLMKRGSDWYEACVESTRVDQRAPFHVPRVIMNYRLPTLYVLLSYLPDGGWIQVLFTFLSCCGLWAVFNIARHLLRADEMTVSARPPKVAQQTPRTGVDNREGRELCALTAALLCSPYLLVGAVTWFYTFHEYWACFAAVASVSFLARRQVVVALLLGILSACIREHFLLVPIVISVLSCRSGNFRGYARVCAGWLLLILVYVVHVWRALPYTGQGVREGTAIWLHWPSLQSVYHTALFGSTLYPWLTATEPVKCLIVPALLVSALWGLWRHRAQEISVGIMGLVILPILAYMFVGPQTPSGGYWGIVYMPWVFLAAPLGIAAWRESLVKRLGLDRTIADSHSAHR